MTFGANAGFAMNPARDLGPRLLCLCVGYGIEVFTLVGNFCKRFPRAHGYYFWIPLFIPFIGALIGAVFYKIFVGLHGPTDEDLFEYKTEESSTETTSNNKEIDSSSKTDICSYV